jgi:hypothetical protein
VCGFVLAAFFSFVLEDGADHHGRRFTWWAVMRRPPLHEPDESGEPAHAE